MTQIAIFHDPDALPPLPIKAQTLRTSPESAVILMRIPNGVPGGLSLYLHMPVASAPEWADQLRRVIEQLDTLVAEPAPVQVLADAGIA